MPEPDPASNGIGWLRATVSRFANGPVHARRRAIVEELVAGVDPGDLRRPYAGHPVAPLARALGVTEPAIVNVVADVRVAAAAYQTGDTAADPAVDRLVSVFGGRYDEATAAHIQLLVQACDATASLIERTRTRMSGERARTHTRDERARTHTPDERARTHTSDERARTNTRDERARTHNPDERARTHTSDERARTNSRDERARMSTVDEVLRDDPPVLATRRVDPDGNVVAVSLSGMPFGAGPRACPGRELAMALVEGALR
ncbi:hypothetical protein [Dactylosporangium sp. NPDC051541]|uniref:hypothetical protein n=1 Tax=Dactylosporangium sp. NPDC051541 TaxID=3363977 RepID=UPI00379F360C